MADNTTTLALDVTSDAAQAASEVDRLADSYAALGREVDQAATIADQAASKLDGVTDAADGLASKSSAATGALGALSSGFDLVGLEQYSGALQSAGMATDFLSGVGDSLTLVLSNQKVAQIASTVASKAATAATKAQTIAQKALNIAQRLNPIGLIIAAVILLIAGLVLLYKRSETFRNIIAKVGEVGKEAISGIVDIATNLADFIRDKVPAAFDKAKNLVVRYIDLITTPYRALFDLVKNAADFVRDKLPEAFDKAKGLIVSAIDAIKAPFQAVIDLVQNLIDKISNIDLGVVGDVAGSLGGLLNRSTLTAATSSTTPASNVVVIPVSVSGVIGDADQVVASIERGLQRRLVALGLTS